MPDTTASDTNVMGAKLALFLGDRIVSIQRDDRPGLLWPGFWDLPGGGREDGETPLECVLRETCEELSLALEPGAITWGRAYQNSIGREVWFFAAWAGEDLINRIRLGEEGQRWCMMRPQEFIDHERAVTPFKSRLRDVLDGRDSETFR